MSETTVAIEAAVTRPLSSESETSITSTDTEIQSEVISIDGNSELPSIGDQVRKDMVSWVIETKAFGYRSFRIWLHPTDTIAEVKQLIDRDHVHLPVNRQILSYRQQIIGPDDSMVCEHENIPKDARITLAFSLQSGLMNRQPPLSSSLSSSSSSSAAAAAIALIPNICMQKMTKSLQFIYYSTVLMDNFYVITVRLWLPQSDSSPSHRGREDEVPAFAGLLTDPLSARLIAEQCTSFLEQSVQPSQIVDITWSQIIIEDDDERASSASTTASDVSHTPHRVAEAITGTIGSLRSDRCDGNRLSYNSASECHLATPMRGCQASNNMTSEYFDDSNIAKNNNDNNANIGNHSSNERSTTDGDPTLRSGLQITERGGSDLMTKLTKNLAASSTDRAAVLEPAKPAEDSLRCHQCNRKISLAHSLFKCRCQRSFCNLHRYSDRHACAAEMNTQKKRPTVIQLAKL